MKSVCIIALASTVGIVGADKYVTTHFAKFTSEHRAPLGICFDWRMKKVMEFIKVSTLKRKKCMKQLETIAEMGVKWMALY